MTIEFDDFDSAYDISDYLNWVLETGIRRTKMKYIIKLIITLFFYSCQNSTLYVPSEREKLSIEITRKVARHIKNETSLIPFGTGGQTSNGVKMLALAFKSQEQLDIDSARKLLISSIKKFKSEVNSNEQIRPYLTTYPFESENFEIRIFIQKRDTPALTVDKSDTVPLSIVSAIDGILKYQIYTPDEKDLITIHQESYDEALQKLQEESSDGSTEKKDTHLLMKEEMSVYL